VVVLVLPSSFSLISTTVEVFVLELELRVTISRTPGELSGYTSFKLIPRLLFKVLFKYVGHPGGGKFAEAPTENNAKLGAQAAQPLSEFDEHDPAI
jgi:hypothetical protein